MNEDDLDRFMAEAMRDPMFRKAYRRAERRAASNFIMGMAVAIKPSRRKRGWRHGR